MAALITPDVIPLLNDEQAMGQYLQASGADYLITAPGWPYLEIVQSDGWVPVYDTNYGFSRENDLNNMTIYLFDTP